MKTHRASLLLSGPVLLLALLIGACAGKSPGADTGPGAAQRRWPGAPNPKVAKLVDAANSTDLLGLAVIHPDAWIQLARQLAPLNAYLELMDEEPWLAGDDLWGPLQVVLRFRQNLKQPALPPPAGWDRTLPLAIGWVDAERPGLLQQFNAALFDGQELPTHIRVILPASDARVLAKALQDLLATLPGEAGPAGRYVLPWNSDSRLGVAILPEEGFVRLELLYFRASSSGEPKKDLLLRELEAATAQPRQHGNSGAGDPIVRLLANGHGAALTVRPSAIARRMILETPGKIAGAVAYAESRMRAPLKAMGASEWLSGYLAVTAGAPEIAEMAMAVNLEHGVEAVTLTRLTPAAQKQMAAFLRTDATPTATSPNALFACSLALPRPEGMASIQPLFSPVFRMRLLRHIGDVVSEGGWPVLMAVLTRPMGIWRSFWTDETVATYLQMPAGWPTDVSFELYDFTLRDRVSFQVRGRLPKNAPLGTTWISLAKKIASDMDEGPSEVRKEAQPDGTWVTWRHNVTQSTVPYVPGRLAKEPAGTFAVARASFAAIADRLAQERPEYRGKSDRDLMQALRLIGRAESRARWRDGWLIGEMRVGVAHEPLWPPFEPPLPKPTTNAAKSGPTPGQHSLEQAVVGAQEFLEALANVPPDIRREVMSHGRAEIASSLARAKRERDTMHEAMALDWLLLNISKDFEVLEAWEAKERQEQDQESDPAIEKTDEPRSPADAQLPDAVRKSDRPKRGR